MLTPNKDFSEQIEQAYSKGGLINVVNVAFERFVTEMRYIGRQENISSDRLNRIEDQLRGKSPRPKPYRAPRRSQTSYVSEAPRETTLSNTLGAKIDRFLTDVKNTQNAFAVSFVNLWYGVLNLRYEFRSQQNFRSVMFVLSLVALIAGTYTVMNATVIGAPLYILAYYTLACLFGARTINGY